MRTLEFMEIIPQTEQTHGSTHRLTRSHKGNTQAFVDSGRGKTQNKDYERLHYENV